MKKSKPKIKKKKSQAKVEISAGGVVFKKVKIKKQRAKIEILLIKDSYGRWALPKGHLEKKETLFRAALREISEETGLKNLKIIKKLNSANYFFRLKGKLIFKIVYYFLVEAPAKSLATPQSKEIKDAIWVSPAESLVKISYAGLKPIISKAKKYLEETYGKF